MIVKILDRVLQVLFEVALDTCLMLHLSVHALHVYTMHRFVPLSSAQLTVQLLHHLPPFFELILFFYCIPSDIELTLDTIDLAHQ